jgi:hypothetical protein
MFESVVKGLAPRRPQVKSVFRGPPLLTLTISIDCIAVRPLPFSIQRLWSVIQHLIGRV